MRSDSKFLLASNGWGSLCSDFLKPDSGWTPSCLGQLPFCEHVLRGPARQAKYQIAKSLLLLNIASRACPGAQDCLLGVGFHTLPVELPYPAGGLGAICTRENAVKSVSGKRSLETPVWEQAWGREFLFLPEDGKWFSESLSSSLTAACQNKPACLALLNDV